MRGAARGPVLLQTGPRGGTVRGADFLAQNVVPAAPLTVPPPRVYCELAIDLAIGEQGSQNGMLAPPLGAGAAIIRPRTGAPEGPSVVRVRALFLVAATHPQTDHVRLRMSGPAQS